jgi:hypothetical protein
MVRPPVAREERNQAFAVSLAEDFGDMGSVAIGDFPRPAFTCAVNPAAQELELLAADVISQAGERNAPGRFHCEDNRAVPVCP